VDGDAENARLENAGLGQKVKKIRKLSNAEIELCLLKCLKTVQSNNV